MKTSPQQENNLTNGLKKVPIRLGLGNLFPSYPLIHINQLVKYGSNPTRTFRAKICTTKKNKLTRLLCRPQPQMYPPVALNQNTLVNRTHKYLIYMLQGPQTF